MRSTTARLAAFAALLCIVAHSQLSHASADETVVMGGLFPLSGSRQGVGAQRSMAVSLAVNAINNNATLLPGVRIAFLEGDTASNPVEGAKSMFSLVDKQGAVGVVGAASSKVSEGAALVGRIFSRLLVSYSSTSQALSNKEVYPLFARTPPVDLLQGQALARLVIDCGWKQVALISGDSSYAIGLLDDFESAGNLAGITVLKRVQHPSRATYADDTAYVSAVDAALTAIKSSPATIIIMSDLDVDAKNVIWRARLMKMIGPGTGYMWLGTDGWLSNSLFTTTSLCDTDCITANKAVAGGILGVTPFVDTAQEEWFLNSTWNPNVGSAQLTAHQKLVSQRDDWLGTNRSSYTTFSYDAGYAVGMAMHKLCYEPIAPLTVAANAASCAARLNSSTYGEDLYKSLLTVKFKGATGDVQFDSAGNRPMPYNLLNVNGAADLSIVGLWNAADDVIELNAGSDGQTCSKLLDCNTVYWPGGGKTPPDGLAVICDIGEEKLISTAGLEFCVSCGIGYYNLHRDSTCKECPRGGVCPGGAKIAADEGYWQLQLNLPETDLAADIVNDDIVYQTEFYECRAAPYACCPQGACTVNQTIPDSSSMCAPQRYGVLCSWCASGHSLWGGECIPCQGTNAGLLTLGIIAGLILLVVLLLRPPSNSAVSTIIIDFYQMVNVVSVVDSKNRNPVFNYLNLVFNLQPQDLGNFCPAEMTPVGTASLGYMLPVMLAIEMLVVYIPIVIYDKFKPKRVTLNRPTDDEELTNPVVLGGDRHVKEPEAVVPFKNRRLTLTERVLVALWRVIFLVYPGTTITALTMLHCRTVGPYQVLESHPSVTCWTPSHLTVSMLGVPILIFFTVGVPVFIIAKFRCKRARWRRILRGMILRNRAKNPGVFGRYANMSRAMARHREKKSVLHVIKIGTRFLKRISPGRGYERDYNMYRIGIRGWFPGLFFTRRLVMIFMAVYLNNDPVWRQISLFVGALVLLAVQLWFRPFRERSEDGIATVAMASLLLVCGIQLYSAAVRTAADLKAQHTSSGRAAFIEVLDVLTLALPAIYFCYVHVMKGYRSLAKRRGWGRYARDTHNAPRNLALSQGVQMQDVNGSAGAGAGAGVDSKQKKQNKKPKARV